jgi:hypothetical protein
MMLPRRWLSSIIMITKIIAPLKAREITGPIKWPMSSFEKQTWKAID